MSDSTIQVLEGLGSVGIEEEGVGALAATALPAVTQPARSGAFVSGKTVAYLAGGLVLLTVLSRRKGGSVNGLGATVRSVYVRRAGNKRRRFVGNAVTYTKAEKRMMRRADRARAQCAKNHLKPGTKAYRNCFKQMMRKSKKK